MQSSPDLPLPTPDDLEAPDASPVRTLDKGAVSRIMERIDEAKKAADTLGGVIEVLAYGVPAGIGTYVESDRRLDAALASAIMGIQAFEGVEIGDGFLEAARPVLRLTMRSWSTRTAASTDSPTVQVASRAACPTAR